MMFNPSNVVVPKPVPEIVSAAWDDVAYKSVDVEMQKFPPSLANVQCFRFVPAEKSDKANCGLNVAETVVEPTCSWKAGVEVLITEY